MIPSNDNDMAMSTDFEVGMLTTASSSSSSSYPVGVKAVEVEKKKGNE